MVKCWEGRDTLMGVVCFRKEMGNKDWSLPPGKCGGLWIMDVCIKNRSHCRLWWWCHWRKTEWKTKLHYKLSTSCVAYDQTTHRSLRMSLKSSCPSFSISPYYVHSSFYFNLRAKCKKFNIWWKNDQYIFSSPPHKVQPLEFMEKIWWHQNQKLLFSS